MKTILNICATDLVTNSISSFLALSYKPKTRIRFSASWQSGNNKCFSFFFIASRALLQSHAEFNRLSYRNFLIFYCCSYYSSMVQSKTNILYVNIDFTEDLFFGFVFFLLLLLFLTLFECLHTQRMFFQYFFSHWLFVNDSK